MTTKKAIKIPSAKQLDQPATRRLLYLVRDELSPKIDGNDRKVDCVHTGLSQKIDAVHAELNQKIDSVHAELNQKIDSVHAELNQKIDSVRSELILKIDKLDQKWDKNFNELKIDLTKMHILLEEQNSDNRIVLEGIQALWQRQDRIESSLEKIIRQKGL